MGFAPLELALVLLFREAVRAALHSGTIGAGGRAMVEFFFSVVQPDA